MTLSESFAVFLENIRGQSSSSRRLYTQRLSGFLEIHGDRSPEEIGPSDINSWVSLLEERGYAEATMAGYRQAIKALFNYLVTTEVINRSPAAHIKTGKFVPKRRKLPREVDVKRCDALSREWLKSGEPELVRKGAFWLLIKATGARLREVIELRKSEVEAALNHGPEDGVYLVVSSGKTGEVILRVPILEMQGVERWLELRPTAAVIDRVFVTLMPTVTTKDPSPRYRPLNRSSATRIIESVSRQAGLEKLIRAHALRHRIGHMITKNFGPKVAAILLNHSDWKTAATAIAFYHHPDETDVNKAIAQMSAEASKEEDQMARLFGVRKK